MFEKITSAIDEAYHIGDTLVFLQECSPENVALNRRLLSEDPRNPGDLTKDRFLNRGSRRGQRHHQPFSAAHDAPRRGGGCLVQERR
jgi:hypothetical protein